MSLHICIQYFLISSTIIFIPGGENISIWNQFAGMYINCVYCGHRYGPDSEVPAAMADVLKEHIEQCPKHPMSALKTRAEKAEATLARLTSDECVEAANADLARQIKTPFYSNKERVKMALQAALDEAKEGGE